MQTDERRLPGKAVSLTLTGPQSRHVSYVLCHVSLMVLRRTNFEPDCGFRISMRCKDRMRSPVRAFCLTIYWNSRCSTSQWRNTGMRYVRSVRLVGVKAQTGLEVQAWGCECSSLYVPNAFSGGKNQGSDAAAAAQLRNSHRQLGRCVYLFWRCSMMYTLRQIASSHLRHPSGLCVFPKAKKTHTGVWTRLTGFTGPRREGGACRGRRCQQPAGRRPAGGAARVAPRTGHLDRRGGHERGARLGRDGHHALARRSLAAAAAAAALLAPGYHHHSAQQQGHRVQGSALGFGEERTSDGSDFPAPLSPATVVDSLQSLQGGGAQSCSARGQRFPWRLLLGTSSWHTVMRSCHRTASQGNTAAATLTVYQKRRNMQ